MDDGFLDLDYLNKQSAVFEDTFLRHIRFKKPLTIIIDGQNNKAAIFKQEYKPSNINNALESSLNDLPPDGFI
jgi:hypothetical protein